MVLDETLVDGHTLRRVLLGPLSISKLMKLNDSENELDVIPIVQTIGFKQVIAIDYKNLFGRGRDCLYEISQPYSQYVKFVSPSI